MNKIILIAIIAVGAWWYFIGNNKLSEDALYGFYKKEQVAASEGNANLMCDLMADDFEATKVPLPGDELSIGSMNKQEVCEADRVAFENFDKVKKLANGAVGFEYIYDVKNIELSADRKSAIISMTYSMKIAGVPIFIAETEDTLVRRKGKTLMSRSDGIHYKVFTPNGPINLY